MVAPTRVGTETIQNGSTSRSAESFSHTTTADTDILLVCVFIEGNEAVSGTPTFDGNDLTLIRDTGSTGAAADVRAYVYGQLAPGAVTGTLAVSFTSTVNPDAVVCINYKDTDSASIAAATNFINEDINTTASSTGVHSSGGSSGNTLLVAGAGQGNDMQHASVDNSFAEVWDEQTGISSSQDFGHIGAELTTGLPSAVTITYGATDQNTSVLIELVAAAAGADDLATKRVNLEGDGMLMVRGG